MRPVAAMARGASARLESHACARAAELASEALGVKLELAMSDRPACVSQLSPRERQTLSRLTSQARIRSWLRGRAALKVLIGGLGNPDTSRLAFPNPSYSLTHTRDLAVAAACRGQGVGVGVDLEFHRPASMTAARFYLNEPEREAVVRLRGLAQDAALIRLWTVKEALFKADPANEDTVLTDYIIDDANALSGVCRSAADIDIRYLTVAVPEGFLSVAVAIGSPSHAE